MTPPVTLLIALMICYPLVQIIATLLRRSKRLRFNALCRDMLADPELGDEERRVVHWFMKDSRGGLHTLTAPLTFSAIVFQYATNSIPLKPWAEDEKAHQSNGLAPGFAIWRDPRLKEIGNLSMQLEAASYPITTAVTASASAMTWIVAALVMLLRGSLPARPSIRELVAASGHANGGV